MIEISKPTVPARAEFAERNSAPTSTGVAPVR